MKKVYNIGAWLSRRTLYCSNAPSRYHGDAFQQPAGNGRFVRILGGRLLRCACLGTLPIVLSILMGSV